MRLLRVPVLLGLVLLVACAETIPEINERPARFYEKSVRFIGRVARMQETDGEALIEVADANERRILVRSVDHPELATGDWIKVRGVLVPEARIGGTTVYDVVVADSISPVRAPMLRNLF